MTKPLILSPAGSFEALCAAVNGGADEVYFGLPEFNARYNAKNFSDEELREALKMCSVLGVKSNITVNTLITDREMPKALDMVYNAASLGADAFIVQDLGFASLIKKEMPSVCLHASTQCACHNLEGAKKLSELGFSRVVLAREMPKEEIQKVIDEGIETEIFVHGALCVCQSGMCLMSSVIGGRSGNRGLCAQPCRLPYAMAENKNRYPLSLKDLSLGTRIEELIPMGVTSLKIEGRMKSPEYVYGTTKIWRELIDGRKNATKAQMNELSDIFSRGGYTDKYFTGEYKKDNRDMYGIRSGDDKQNTRETEKKLDFSKTTRKRTIGISCQIEAENPVKAAAFCGDVSVSITSDFTVPFATGRPLTEDDVKESLSKLGTTFFEAESIDVTLKGDVFLSKSMLNSVRRSLAEELEKVLYNPEKIVRNESRKTFERRKKAENFEKLYVCTSLESAKKIKGENVCIPLSDIEKYDGRSGFGVALPRVIYSCEMQEFKRLLCVAKQKGAEFALVSNIGQVDAVKESGLSLFGNIGMNVFNSSTIDVLENMGFSLITVSPELNEAQVRDLGKKQDTKLCAFTRGRLPLMVLESCIVRAGGVCKGKNDSPCGVLHDRMGMDFPVYGERRLTGDGYPCRNIIYNSVETDILSKEEKLSKMNIDMAMINVLE
ncbi:MAG: U32 family peptidase [Clostridia bacterium]|nr:U32 family peptidase [Clostridia bacterium]MBO5417488.1 U32 family peptidase [Clostridia bacterium]